MLNKHLIVAFTAAFLFISISIRTKAQTTLSTGDVAFTSYSTEPTASDTFGFMLLVNITSGTQIIFTDGLYTDATGYFQLHSTTTDWVCIWTASSSMTSGTQVKIWQNGINCVGCSPGTSAGTVTGRGLVLPTSGDQLFACQGGTIDTTTNFRYTPGTVLAGIHFNLVSGQSNAANWDDAGVGTSTSNSQLPNSLTTGTNAVWILLPSGLSGEADNARYDCSVVTGTASALRSAINDSANWDKDDATVFSPALCSPAATTWNGSTWDNGTPTSTLDAIIASSTTPGSFTCQNLTINSGVALTINSGSTATINGGLTNSGNGISGTGTVDFDASGSLSGNAISFGGTLIVSSGATLTTGGLLTLTSTSNSSFGQIGNSAGTISGNVTVQRYIPGKRAFRFMGHPFNGAQALTALTDDIDITGSGGATNGFTATSTNNPSAYWFDVSAADNSTAGNNTGWTAFTHTNGSGANSWDQYELMRILVRGTPGQGLTGGSYSPSAVTLDMTGAVNQGTQVVTLAKGSGSTFVSCGNPFPCGVQMNTVAKGSNIGSNYYVWDATSGAAGAYVTNAFTLSYVLPPFAALFTTASANSNNTLTFEEADKDASGSGLFKGTSPANWVELLISDSSVKWDRLLINLDDNAMDVEDNLDGKKLYNPGLDFFTLSKDNVRLAVDVRPYNDGNSIPLGLTAYNRYNRYVIKTGMFDIPAGTKLYLHDKYLNKKEELKAGFEYWFDVTTDTLSQGNNRFEINMVGQSTNGIATIERQPAIMQLIPNPAREEVKISFDKLEGKAQLKLTSITGQVIFSREINAATGSVTILLHGIPAGMYIAELYSQDVRFTEKLVIE